MNEFSNKILQKKFSNIRRKYKFVNIKITIKDRKKKALSWFRNEKMSISSNVLGFYIIFTFQGFSYFYCKSLENN